MMVYTKEKMISKAKSEIKKNQLLFVEDVISYLPCSKSTFYELFPAGSDGLDLIKSLLEANRMKMKVSMRKKWLGSDAPALQTALYKLIGTDSERKKLSMQYQETELKGGIKTESRFSLEAIPDDLLFDVVDKIQQSEYTKEMEAKEKSE